MLYYHFFIVVETPLILADEGGYIANARYIATNSGLIDLRATVYYPGISLFYAPVFLFTNNLGLAYKIIQLINILIATSIPVLTFKILEQITNIDDEAQDNKTLLLLSVVSFMYPSVFCFVNLALPEVLLTALFLTIVYLLLKIESNIKALYLIILLFTLFLLFLSHSRTIVILISLLFFSIYFYINNNNIFILFIAIIIAIFALDKLLVEKLIEAYLAIALDENSISINNLLINKLIFSNLTSIAALKSLSIEIIGQLWYLTVSSFGLIWFGYKRLINNIVINRFRYTSLFIIMTSIGMLLLSSLFMNIEPTRGDHYIYGRYNEFVWIIIFVLGIYSFLTDSFSKRYLIGFIICIFTFLICFVLLKHNDLQNLSFNHNNILGIYIYYYVFKTYNILYISLSFSMLIIILILLKRIKKINNKILIGTIICYFIINNYFVSYKYYKHDSDVRMTEHELSQFINKNIQHNSITIGYDRQSWSSWHYYNYQLYSNNISMYRFDRNNIDKHSFEYVISGAFYLNSNYRLIALENHHYQNLFILKSTELYKHFVISGYVLPEDFPSALPKEALKYRINNISLNKDCLSMSIHHLGAGSFWPNMYGVKKPKYSVRIGIQYFNKNKEKIFEERKELPGSVYPKNIINIEIELSKEYKADIVKIDLVQEGVSWFEENGNTPLVLQCEDGQYRIIDKVITNESSNILYSRDGYSGVISNFNGDNVWTKDISYIKELDYNIKDNNILKLATYGWNPLLNDINKLKLKIYINEKEAEFLKYQNKNFYFRIPEKTINIITIKSNTFNPKEMGINNDTRDLGIDIKSMETVKELPE